MIRAIHISFIFILCLLSFGKAVAQVAASAEPDYYIYVTKKIVEDSYGKREEYEYEKVSTKKNNTLLKSSMVQSASSSSCACNCLKPFFDYLIQSQRLFIKASDHIILSSLIQDANNAGYNVSYTECPLLSKNINKYFYALTNAATGTLYKARIGDCEVSLKSLNSNPVNFYQLSSDVCENGKISYRYGQVVKKTFYVTRSLSVSTVGVSDVVFPTEPVWPVKVKNTSTTRIFAGNRHNLQSNPGNDRESYEMRTYFAFDSLATVPKDATWLSAKLKLYADPGGFAPPAITTAHSTTAELGKIPISILTLPYYWNYNTSIDSLYLGPFGHFQNSDVSISSNFENVELDVKDWRLYLMNGDNAKNGFVMWGNRNSDGRGAHGTFASQRHPDVSRHPTFDITYSTGGATGLLAELQIDSCYNCNPVPSGICYSAVTDTSVNPFIYGIAGNWRAYRSYAYYSTRAETDPSQATNIRKDGTFNDFAAFWSQVSGSLQPQQDTTKWVWNSETTLFNRKGIELENKDPLGRYNAGLYGYDDALPVAVIQNSRFRESAFDGFEDYYFGNNICDTACSGSRNFDFSAYKSNLDTTQQHTGRYSLKVPSGSSAGISAKLVTVDDNAFGLSFNKAANNCPGGGQILTSVRANADALLPTFSPLSGKKVVVSAWAKESQDCNGTSYTGNQISIVVAQGSTSATVIAKPTGNIIEGWQRYEQVVELPAGATMLSVNLQSTGSADVYFDDVRIHPYNANMKSFVYNPVNLRLMSELDENNYATFYEYDDDGALIRLKKETSRGIKTIRETRNGLLKEETP